ncbi:hypothetical protein VNO78_15176 [Psophocarpus tetragonolobus]|uniref:Uncharacterized protein n=1 Tax=Psophocarpus tetragonolobus TaxID=3891 RepID=A0AAN9SI76_PSOTE
MIHQSYWLPKWNFILSSLRRVLAGDVPASFGGIGITELVSSGIRVNKNCVLKFLIMKLMRYHRVHPGSGFL